MAAAFTAAALARCRGRKAPRTGCFYEGWGVARAATSGRWAVRITNGGWLTEGCGGTRELAGGVFKGPEVGPNGTVLMAQPTIGLVYCVHISIKQQWPGILLLAVPAPLTPYALHLARITHLCDWPGPCKKLQKCFLYVLLDEVFIICSVRERDS